MSVLKSHWICNLGTEIHQLLLSYNNLAIHKAKVACLCNELNNFSKQILPRVKTDEQVTPVQNVMLRELMQCIHNLKILFSQFTPNTLAETLLRESPTSAGEKLNNFRQTFNKIVKDLGICNYDPCPLDDAQLKVDDSDDVNVIVMYLGKLATSSRTIIEQQEYTRKLNEYKEIQKKYQEEEEKSQIQKNEESRIMTQEEINSRVTDLADYSVNFDDFELQAKIGNGAFAEVFLSYQKSTHKMVALKKLFNQQFTVKEFEMFLREIKIFQKLQHFAVLQFVGVCLRPPFCIATEYMSGGSLFTRLHNGSELYGTKLTIIALGVAIGMAHLHDNNMIHRDLKSTNVLLDADDFPRICDFGMSREMAGPNDPPMSGGVGTAQWMAPEVIQYQKYDQKADVYSYGILLWELLTREVPFQGLNNVQIAIAVTNRDSRPLIPQSCPPKLSQLIKICWDKDPNKRPDFKMITKAFESGEISFPGTEQEFVQAYVNQFSKVETKSTEFNPENVSKESVQQIIKEINDPNKRDDGISKMLSIKEVHLWTKLLNEAGIIIWYNIIDIFRSNFLREE
ncbi:TKL family protein kinase [Histomonas meleagridis]|uniref:TKL family protein kinase n=1 Tax=Histomonas meleagridis TaxID=135588 RepID=UPI003559E422|nr:TKL family protein kinase [Histomonas meleagridis]KAH0806120.1 TKL family protein kinase [Histomonas meleagridis]